MCFSTNAQEKSTKEKYEGMPKEEKGVQNAAGLAKQPEYPGGIKEFYNDVLQNFIIPKVPNEGNYKIYVSFVIEKDGSMTSIKVLRDPGYGMGEEAVRVLKNLDKKWSPGEIGDGEIVRASYNLPIVLNITK